MNPEIFTKIDWSADLSDLPLGVQVLSTPEQISYALSLKTEGLIKNDKICMFGIGDSGIPGDIISDYADKCSSLCLPSVCEGKVPGWIDEKTTVILSSYTGISEEIMDVYTEVRKRNCNIIAITSGGVLAESCEKNNVPLFKVPAGLTSRSAMGCMVGRLASVVQCVSGIAIADRLKKICPLIEEYRNILLKRSSDVDLLAHMLENRVLAVYSCSNVRAMSKRWKMSINKNLDKLAFFSELPEFDHNELVGWSDKNPHAPELKVIILRTETEGTISHIVDSMVEVLKENDRDVLVIDFVGDDPLVKDMKGMVFGDALSVRMSEIMEEKQ